MCPLHGLNTTRAILSGIGHPLCARYRYSTECPYNAHKKYDDNLTPKLFYCKLCSRCALYLILKFLLLG